MSKVVVYSTEWCPWCVKLKEWLKENKVKFTEKDVEADEAASEEMLKKTGGDERVPATDVDGKMIQGFDVPALKKALKLK